METTFSGYCRNQDAARLVLCEAEKQQDGSVETEVDCDYFCCAYRSGCPIGEQIAAFLTSAGQGNTI